MTRPSSLAAILVIAALAATGTPRSAAIGKADTGRTATVTNFPIPWPPEQWTPGSSVASGPDKNLWFAGPDSDNIGRITTNGRFNEFRAGISARAFPHDIVAGPDGNMWFTERGLDRVARITPSGVVTEFSAGISPGAKPWRITAGPDGNLWFTEPGAGAIGRITPEGEVTEFSGSAPESPAVGLGIPNGIAAGPGGALWFTLSRPDAIGRMTMDGAVTVVSRGITPGAGLEAIVAGPDGNLWFTERARNAIGRITPQGVVTEFAPAMSGDARPYDIVAGPDGNMWFTDTAFYGRLGRISTSGRRTQFWRTGGGGLAVGSDRNLWLATAHGIARVLPARAPEPVAPSFRFAPGKSRDGHLAALIIYGAPVGGRVKVTCLSGCPSRTYFLKDARRVRSAKRVVLPIRRKLNVRGGITLRISAFPAASANEPAFDGYLHGIGRFREYRINRAMTTLTFVRAGCLNSQVEMVCPFSS